MGARGFATDTNKFLQPDQFNNALSNLALGSDPITQNRYSLAGGNPLSSIEWDGHYPIPDGGGYNDPSPNPGTAVTSQQLGRVQRSSESQPTAWNPFTWNWNAAGGGFLQWESHYQRPLGGVISPGVARGLRLRYP